MVAKLALPEDDSITVLRAVISEREKFRDFYNALTEAWVLHVQNYLEHHGDPQIISPLVLSSFISEAAIIEEEAKTNNDNRLIPAQIRVEQKRKKSLIGLYSPKEDKSPYVILDKLRRKHNLLFCPCCGEPGKPTTLDHYLPKTSYPELSIIIANLTPMCSECQQKKSSDYLDANGDKIYIHPYFDAIEQVQLSINITAPYTNPTFTLIVPDDGVDDELHSLLIRHINGIDFLERFDEFCRNEYMALLRTMSLERQDEAPESAQRIIRRFKRQYDNQSQNRWEAIFYRGIFNNNNLLNYLDSGILPEFT
ncbi:HNH endonuclease [Rahnella sp. SAP-1]|uniref:HNH endonuclease n=1 Tax=Rouxiella aceris TaxID=2703884 RepID=A0A848MNL6_9GAMM|nr:HNH endonuclease [Rouxiella aceris]NMP28679.1 HNH endonuclease [Rouxiella aceris]